MSEDEMHDYYIRSATETPNILVIQNNKPILTIKPDGTVELGPDVTLDEASRLFWNNVSMLRPRCPHCGK